MINPCSSFNVAVGLLAASWTSSLLVVSSVLEGGPVLGNVPVVAIFSPLVDERLHCVHGISEALEMFLEPSPD